MRCDLRAGLPTTVWRTEPWLAHRRVWVPARRLAIGRASVCVPGPTEPWIRLVKIRSPLEWASVIPSARVHYHIVKEEIWPNYGQTAQTVIAPGPVCTFSASIIPGLLHPFPVQGCSGVFTPKYFGWVPFSKKCCFFRFLLKALNKSYEPVVLSFIKNTTL